ncbi:MAG: GGDEF domain-containing protein [Actinomycetota bacterium]
MSEGASTALTVLALDADDARVKRARAALAGSEEVRFVVEAADHLEGGLRLLDAGGVDVVLFALDLPDGKGSETIAALRDRPSDLPVVAVVRTDDDRGAAAALAAGAVDFVTEADLDGEVLRRTIRYALERHRLQAELSRRTVIDELTGLFNAQGFEQLATRYLRLADRTGQPVVLLLVRLEDLPEVSETHGTTEGSRLLADTAAVLQTAVREVDIAARLGADTFSVLLTGDALGAEALVLSRLVGVVATHNARSGLPYRLSLSVGAATYEPKSRSVLADLIREADGRMRERAAGSGST